MSMQGVDNVDYHFSFVHIVHICLLFRLFPFCVDAMAWTFVDNVDSVDTRFKLVADEASTYVDTLAYIYLTLFSLTLVVVNSLSTLSTLSQSPRPCWLCAWVKLSFIQCPTIVQPLSTFMQIVHKHNLFSFTQFIARKSLTIYYRDKNTR